MLKLQSAAQWGLGVGRLPAGPRNSIADVPGVTVGHATVDTPQHKTGVTVIFPAQDNLFLRKMTAAAFVWNGFGKTTGLPQVQELGVLETPIALTNTLNVGLVQDAMVEYTLERCRQEGFRAESVNAIVGECNDGRLNDIQHRAVDAALVRQAIASAGADFAQGDVGAGKGTVCHGLKGGIGSASRQVQLGGKVFTVGLLVQSNYGALADLTLSGHLMGPQIEAMLPAPEEPIRQDKGSILMVLGTDLPLSDRQLGRVLRRCSVGLARLGSYVGHGSGEVMIGFSTAGRFAHQEERDLLPAVQLREEALDPVFRAAADACQEAVLHSMLFARPVTGYDGRTIHALAEFLPRLLPLG